MNCEELALSLSENEAAYASTCPVDGLIKRLGAARAVCCGRSVMCREGIRQLLAIAGDIAAGKGQAEDTALMRDIAEVMRLSGDCAPAVAVANAALSTLSADAENWSAHIKRRRCLAGVCVGCEAPPTARADDGSGSLRRRRRG